MKFLHNFLKSVRVFHKMPLFIWFKGITRTMLKAYFVITILIAVLLHFTKESLPLEHVAVMGMYWGYTIAVTYWLIGQERIPEKWTNLLHFLLWLIPYMLSGIKIVGAFELFLVNFLLIDYWFIRWIQIMIARKHVESTFNEKFSDVKNRWNQDEFVSYERHEGLSHM